MNNNTILPLFNSKTLKLGFRVAGGLEPISGVTRQKDTPDKSPLCGRVNTERQTTWPHNNCQFT